MQVFAAGGTHCPEASHATAEPFCGGQLVSPGVHDCVQIVALIVVNGLQSMFTQSCSVLHGSYVIPMHFCPPSEAGELPVHAAAIPRTTTAKLRSMHSS